MCGFVGIYLNDSSLLEVNRYEKVLSKMSKVIEPRGPDDKGMFIESMMTNFSKKTSSLPLASPALIKLI